MALRGRQIMLKSKGISILKLPWPALNHTWRQLIILPRQRARQRENSGCQNKPEDFLLEEPTLFAHAQEGCQEQDPQPWDLCLTGALCNLSAALSLEHPLHRASESLVLSTGWKNRWLTPQVYTYMSNTSAKMAFQSISSHSTDKMSG